MTPEQLKASLLQYAIQGKLVEQRPEEGTADELLELVKKKKDELIKKKIIKKRKPLEQITEEDLPFEIPASWKWVKWGDIVNIVSARRVHQSDWKKEGVPFYRAREIAEMSRTGGVVDNELYISEELYKEFSASGVPKPGDIMVTAVGTLGKTYIVKETDRFYYKDASVICFENHYGMCSEYLSLMMQTPLMYQQIKSNSDGTTVATLTMVRMVEYLLPLPPIEEQRRIVAKIEEILPYVDRYAEAYEKLEQFNARFPEDMKKSILQYAIQGKLVEQRPDEGTAEELYRQIQDEKQKLIKEGRIKKEKLLDEITEDEIPFDIPDSWKWVKLGDCTSYSQKKDKISPSEITPDMWSLDLEDIQKESGKILVRIKASERKISGDKVKFYKNQVLYSKLRPYLKKILVAPDDGVCTPELVPFNTYLIDENYLVYVLRSPHVDNVINAVTYGVKMPRVGTDTMKNLLIPLPPLEEQKRIVAKIEELLPLCSKLSVETK